MTESQLLDVAIEVLTNFPAVRLTRIEGREFTFFRELPWGDTSAVLAFDATTTEAEARHAIRTTCEWLADIVPSKRPKPAPSAPPCSPAWSLAAPAVIVAAVWAALAAAAIWGG